MQVAQIIKGQMLGSARTSPLHHCTLSSSEDARSRWARYVGMSVLCSNHVNSSLLYLDGFKCLLVFTCSVTALPDVQRAMPSLIRQVCSCSATILRDAA